VETSARRRMRHRGRASRPRRRRLLNGKSAASSSSVPPFSRTAAPRVAAESQHPADTNASGARQAGALRLRIRDPEAPASRDCSAASAGCRPPTPAAVPAPGASGVLTQASGADRLDGRTGCRCCARTCASAIWLALGDRVGGSLIVTTADPVRLCDRRAQGLGGSGHDEPSPRFIARTAVWS
jgi:hypothetical protein